MRFNTRHIVLMAGLFALFHIVVVALPVLISAGSGEAQAFAAALFDLPIVWLLGLFSNGRAVLHGSSPTLYILIFSAGGTLMYAAIGALLGCGIHFIDRAFRPA
jgi:hypothetical protein